MPTGDASFANFETELNRLVEKFGQNLDELKGSGYDEAKLRLEYLDPFFRALGLDIENRTDKSRHDKLVLLVDKLLGLMPKLRAATSDSEKATLQNAVTATDQQIDQLVYELYALTPEEIALVEGTA